MRGISSAIAKLLMDMGIKQKRKNIQYTEYGNLDKTIEKGIFFFDKYTLPKKKLRGSIALKYT
jgi:hypothetical protein